MFTGIVREVGEVAGLRRTEEGAALTIRAPALRGTLEVGASVAVDGACLTVEELTADGFRVTVVGATLSRTIAGGYREGSRPNLEPALRLDQGLDGHLVQGHVDGVGEVVAVRAGGEGHLLDVRIPHAVHARTILHGSIALNGVSLTVNALPEPPVCQVALIPLTLRETNLSALDEGDPVNVEGDLIGKYVGRLMR